jgi:hypothetical protein
MLRASLERLLREVDDNAVVLDVGGWAKPLSRADWVIDYLPYDTRGRYGRDGDGPERFSRERWIRRDLCEREPFPFRDGEIDFVVCSHTLEDLRDPIWTCGEINRVGRAGYVELPSRLEEQSYGVQGPWVGWGHHRWLVDVRDGRIEFVFKHHILHGRPEQQFPPGFHDTLRPEERVTTLWWRDAFDYGERLFYDPAELDEYLAGFVSRELGRRPHAHRASRKGLMRRRLVR